MIISLHCRMTADSSEEGCIPLSYIMYFLAFFLFIILVVGILGYRQHAKNRRALKEQGHDLEAWNCNFRPGLARNNSTRTDVSLPPSYHMDEFMEGAAALSRSATSEAATPSPVLSPIKTREPGHNLPSVNYSRRSLRDRRFSSKQESLSPLSILTPPLSADIARQYTIHHP